MRHARAEVLMFLTRHEQERLLVHVAADVAWRRRERGLRLNHPEATAVITGDRPVQVGSHYHFAEANPALDFDRAAARGYRLAVPAGTSVRFEPAIPRDVELVALGGARVVPGLRGETAGPLDPA